MYKSDNVFPYSQLGTLFEWQEKYLPFDFIP